MKIFIDSASVDEIKTAYSYGIIDGVTTNPSKVKQAVDKTCKNCSSKKLELELKKIIKVAGKDPVSIEVTETSYEGMVKQAKAIVKKFGNVYVKIPVSPDFSGKVNMDGIRAINTITPKIKVNATLIFTPEQALLAAKAGASFVSPFCGREDDFIRSSHKVKFSKTDYYPQEGMMNKKGLINDNGIISGVDLVHQCVHILKDYKTEVLAASIRNVRQFRECALAGAHIATIPMKVLKKLVFHPKSTEGMVGFMKDTVEEYSKLLK